jgi:hypothetical protein
MGDTHHRNRSISEPRPLRGSGSEFRLLNAGLFERRDLVKYPLSLNFGSQIPSEINGRLAVESSLNSSRLAMARPRGVHPRPALAVPHADLSGRSQPGQPLSLGPPVPPDDLGPRVRALEEQNADLTKSVESLRAEVDGLNMKLTKLEQTEERYRVVLDRLRKIVDVCKDLKIVIGDVELE